MSFDNHLKSRVYGIINYLIRRKGLFSLAIGLGCLPAIYPSLKNFLQWQSVLKDDQEEKILETSEEAEYILLKDNYDYRTQYLASAQFLKTIKQTYSHHRAVRHQAVDSLSRCSELSDVDAYQLGQSCNQQTLIALARYKEVNSYVFPSPPPTGILEKAYAYEECLKEKPCCNLVEEFYTLLSLLPSADDKCIRYFTDLVSQKKKTDLEDKGIWLEDEYQPTNSSKKFPEELFEKYLLQALLRHSLLKDHQHLIIQNGGLQLLTKIYKLRKNNDPMMCLIAKIILALSVNLKFHSILYSGGWTGILHNWLKSPNIQLSSIAASALANLDSDDKNQPINYSDGLYLLSPFCRNNEAFNADVIFIHGIRGSAFRTWRQKDVTNKKETDVGSTKCWPKDWLAKGTSNIRIIAVDYESEFSEWNVSCSYDKERQLLHNRSKELLEKLVSAGVGRRPIIWVSHSMGGLIVKQILVNAATAASGTLENDIFWNSSGLVFYSVPHNGTSVATKLSTQAQYLFFPSAEVKELQHGSEKLKELHEKFRDILKKNKIPCLSFGEGKKTSFGLKFNAYIVNEESSDFDFGEFYSIPSNHLNVCKPENPQSQNYTKLLEFLHSKVPQSSISHQSIFHDKCAAEREHFLLAFG